MAIFQPPPVPPVNVGGAQPYAPKVSAPSNLVVPNPPFTAPSRQSTSDPIIAAWQPTLWPYVMVGAQPYGPPPQSIPIAPAWGPYAPKWLSGVQTSWQPPDPQPTLPKNLSPGIPGQSADPPPFVHEGRSPWLPNILVTWQPPDPLPTLPPKYIPLAPSWNPYAPKWQSGVLTSWVPPDPQPTLPTIKTIPQAPSWIPFARGSISWLSGTLTSWQPPDPLPTLPKQLSPGIPGQSIDPPPPFAGILGDYIQIISTAWQQPDPLPTLPRYIPPQVTVTYVPFTNKWLSGVVGTWQSPDPQPTLSRNLNPQITAVQVDNPPGFINDYIPDPISPWPIVLPRYYVQPFVAVAYTPPARSLMPTIAATWQTPDPQPTLPKKLNPSITSVRVDNPPGFTNVLIYTPDDVVMPVLPRYLAQPAVTVTYVPHVSLPQSIIATWQLPDPQPTLANKLNPQITAVRVDNPPGFLNDFVSTVDDPFPVQLPRYYPQAPAVVVTYTPQVTKWLSGVLTSWQSPDPQPTLPRNLNPQITTVRTDNPPGFTNVLIYTPEDVVMPTVPRYFVQPVIVTYTPPSRSLLPNIIASWQLPDPLPTLPHQFVQRAPAWQPYAPKWLSGTLTSWQPPDPWPTQRPALSAAFGVTVNNPPFTHYGRIEITAGLIYRSWLPPDPSPTLANKLNPSVTAVRVDFPPGFLNDFISIPDDPFPIQRPRYFPQTSAVVVVTYTPQVTKWLSGVLTSWQPPNIPPTLPKQMSPGIPGQSADPPPGFVNQFIVVPADYRIPIVARNLNPRITAVRVDNPPFDMRGRITKDIVATWQPELIYYSTFYGRARLIPFTQATIVKHPLLAGTYTVATLIGIDGRPVLGSTKQTPSVSGTDAAPGLGGTSAKPNLQGDP